MLKPTTRQVVEAAGISRTYAHDILNDRQNPSTRVAIRIYRTLGWRHPLIADLTEDQIAALEAVERAA